jgi:hypothetical protein
MIQLVSPARPLSGDRNLGQRAFNLYQFSSTKELKPQKLQ